MKTSKIIIRPFVPTLKDEKTEGREPFAVLAFGNVVVEIDYTLLRYIKIDLRSDLLTRTNQIYNRAIDELLNEMHVEMDGVLPRYHRDSEEFKRLPISANPLSLFSDLGNIRYVTEEEDNMLDEHL